MPNFRKVITQTMGQLSKKDLDGALPYLMLTSKSESVVRDLLAFRLHEKFQGKHYAVAREWSFAKKQKNKKESQVRADIAILAPIGKGAKKQFQKLNIVLEIKMVAAPSNGAAVSRALNSLVGQLKTGRKKSKRPGAEYFGLLAVRICPGMSDKNTRVFDEIILNRKKLLAPLSDLEKKFEKIDHKLAEGKKLSRIDSGTIEFGKERYLQAAVNLRWWLFVLQGQ